MTQPDLFLCKNCGLFTPTMSNYGLCEMGKIGSTDRAVYENASICEMERRLFNNKLLSDRLKGIISHDKMYEMYRRV